MSALTRLGFISAQPALLRAVCHTDTQLTQLGLTPVPAPGTGVAQMVMWIQRTWAVREVREMVRHASPSLARCLDAVSAGEVGEPGRVGAMVLSLAAYCRRAVTRPAPFGLFAGVCEISFGSEAVAQWGEDHQAVARADGRWLTEIIQALEAIPRLRERLWLTASNVTVRRGDRLVVPWQQRRLDAAGTEVEEVGLGREPEVRSLMALAASPVLYGDLLHKIRAEFPQHDEECVRALLDKLIARRVLLTCLQPPATEPDALGHLVRGLIRAGAQRVAECSEELDGLKDVHQLMAAHNRSGGRAGGLLRAEIHERMARLGSAEQPVTVDVLLDAKVVLPREVAWEAEKAAETLARISPEPYGNDAWRAYRARFLDRYGPGVLVPVLEVTGPGGLGLPEGYHGTPTVGTAPAQMSPRDATLLAAAQHAALTGEELVLDDDLIERLAVGDPAAMTLPAHLELLFDVHSPSLQALERGRFDLAVRGCSRGWGHLSGGRFAALLASQPASRLLQELGNGPTHTVGARRAQLSFPSLSPSGADLARTPRLVPAVIALNEHRRPAADLIELSDLAVLCDGHLLHLVSRSRRQVIEPGSLQPLQIECQTPALARFLDELVRGQAVQMTGPAGTLRPMHWGIARHLPVLPRLRRGRSVLSPAMWLLGPSELPGARASIAQWEDVFAALRCQRRIPDRVLVERFDNRLALDLTRPGDLALLRAQVTGRKPGPLHLVEAPAPDAHGWAGRPTEVVALLRSARPAQPAPLLPPVAERRCPVQPVGASRYLRARLYGPIQARADLLSDRLPALVDELGHPAWWFRPKDGRDPHLELTVRMTDSQAAAAAVHHLGTWSGRLLDTGAISDLALLPYRPRVGLWGHGALLEAAENARAADCAVIADQTRRRDAQEDPRAVAAAAVVGIVEGFLGSREAVHAWLTAWPKDTAGGRLPQGLQHQVTLLIDTGPGSKAAPLWGARRHALGTYRDLLRHGDGIDAKGVLEELVHEHCQRALGPGHATERIVRRLARTHAITALARRAHRTQPPPP
ncbi:lantibiotic dehydratase [Streptomyces mobaraensis]|uniref:Lantibiotic dehydratase n=1 Tax=Streptomyces mobaraensis TaxID=35621 RepID=A0A5N5W155_STRMB|nr:lantibiotic dehydratase [Streptomyces mobaraensis]KAB7835529.1 hypothetical protein FRZ00_26940 [Streptomyces mobaraensis]